MFTYKNLMTVCCAAVLALGLAACGSSSDDDSASGPAAGGTSMTGAISLPAGHGLMEGTTTLASGETRVPRDGEDLIVTCTPAEGSTGCRLTVTEDPVLGTVGAMATGGTVMVAFAMPPVGYKAYENLAGALLDDSLAKLKANLYFDVEDVMANAAAEPPVMAEDNGGGVTTSLTTHEEPASEGSAATDTGVSDIFVSVDPMVDDPNDMDNEKTVQVVDETPNDDADERTRDMLADDAEVDQVRDPAKIENPVLVDENGMVTTDRMANFDAEADWDLNPAAEWMAALMGGSPQEEGFWRYVLSTADEGESLAGGRTLHLDLRSDFDPNNTSDGMTQNIARGPASDGDPDRVQVPVSMVSFNDFEIATGNEIDFAMGKNYAGSYMGVKGTFSCVDGDPQGDERDICRVNQHTPGMLTPSEDGDLLTFTPLVYTPDTDWLAAGVWLTIPNDPEGDFAIGAFAYGNNPYKPATENAAQMLTGEATYDGQAFGRYAEATGDDRSDGAFEAKAVLTADFGADDAMGSIQGDLTEFMADGDSRDWDVNFEQAMLKFGVQDDEDPETTDPDLGPALRFDAGASGHGTGGHALTGYWNGQFFGTPAADAMGDDLQPGSAAGTFGVTTERDNADDYSLTMIGAYATHKKAEAAE